jgi:hypothetical protein
VATVSRLVAIDPDCDLFGWALFDDGILFNCDVAITPYLPTFAGFINYVCEIPEDRPGTRYRKNDIIRLALAAGRIVGARQCKFVTPTEWKGQVPKAVHHRRMRGVMSKDELFTLDTALENTKRGAHPEILDAVALGLTELGRL